MLEEPVGLFYSRSVLSKYMAEWRMCNSLYALWGCGFPFGSFAILGQCGSFMAVGFVCFAWGLPRFFWLPFFLARSIPWPHSLPHLHKHLGWHNAGNGAEAGTYSPRKGVGRSAFVNHDCQIWVKLQACSKGVVMKILFSSNASQALWCLTVRSAVNRV